MDFDLDADQQAICDAVDAVLDRYAGPARAIELQLTGAYDAELEGALHEAGFLDIARDDEMGPLEAALVTEAVARRAGVMAVGAAALVAPAVCKDELPLPIAIVSADHRGPIRFAASARTLLIHAGDEARVHRLEEGASQRVDSTFGYPMGSAPEELARLGESLGAGSGDTLERWWRLALVLEAVGTMRAALDQTVGYLKQRKQFGRTIASFQAVQHRLAGCAIVVEGSRWLALEAAHHRAPAEGVATAAAHAMQAAAQVFAETHQLSGAIGYTREHDLHVWSMRLQALRLEMGGVSRHRRALVEARWGGA